MSKGTINIDERLPEESVTSSTTVHIRELEARLEKEKADADSERRRREEDDKARRRREDILFIVSIYWDNQFLCLWRLHLFFCDKFSKHYFSVSPNSSYDAWVSLYSPVTANTVRSQMLVTRSASRSRLWAAQSSQLARSMVRASAIT